MRYYPVHLDLADRPVLVVGGGGVAEGKATQLLEAGARLRLVSPEVTDRLAQIIAEGGIDHRARRFDDSDLEGVVLVIGATDDESVNARIAGAARARGVLCNIVDRPALCDFITPALIVRGGLQIGISTSGGSPVLAQRVKREIGEIIGEEYGELLVLASEMRERAKRLVPDFGERRDLLRAFVESEAIDLLRSGRSAEARQLIEDLLREWREKNGSVDGAEGSNERGADRALGA